MVEQHYVRVETVNADALAAALERFEPQCIPTRQLDIRGGGNIGAQAADAHDQAGVTQYPLQRHDALQVERVARVVLRDQQHPRHGGVDILDGGHGGLHAQRLEFRI